MNKKILLGLGAVVAVVAGIAGMAAYEAHVINVTAHIENALAVQTRALEFGTVFPQEYLEKTFDISLSKSFMEEGNADDVNYVINQKPKCWNNNPLAPVYAAVNYWDDKCPGDFVQMENLCQFLSKLPVEEAGEYNDTGMPSYFMGYEQGCFPKGQVPGPAIGKLAKSQEDTIDTWTVDLKVPPVAGTVGQDWPANCAAWTVPVDGTDYGCDLWIEVTGISRVPTQKPNTQILSLENKHGEGWFITVDQTYGTLEFNPSECTFDFTLTAQGLTPGIDYSLIYYADGWPGNHPGALIWNGLTNGSGEISYSGSVDLGMNLPTALDTNAPGAKIWLIPSSAYDSTTKSVTAWPYTDKWLFEYNLIQYTDTGTCPPTP